MKRTSVVLLVLAMLLTVPPLSAISQGTDIAIPSTVAPLATSVTEGIDGRETSRGPVFSLDVGATGDSDPAAQIYLDEESGVSAPLANGTRTYRNISEGQDMDIHVRTDSLQLADNGVPYRHAILRIAYKDVVDETDCYRWASTRSYCRPYVRTLLEYGDLEWNTLWGIGGYNDHRWKNATVHLEANPWQTLRSIDGHFHFNIYNKPREEHGQALPIDHVNLTFVDDEAFYRSREWERANRSLERADFQENATIDPGDHDGKYVLYSRNYLEKIYPNSVPRAHEITSNLSTFEVAGNHEPLSFAIYAFENLSNVRVRVSDLVKAGGGTIPSTEIVVDRVVCLDKKWGYSYSQYYGTNPWYLQGFDALDVAAGTSQQVWLTVYVPEDTELGIYEGTVTVEGDDMEPSELSLSMEVYDLELDDPDATPYLYHSPYLSSKQYSVPRDVAARDMARHGINPIIYFRPIIREGDHSVDYGDLPAEFESLEDLGILPNRTRVIVLDNYYRLWYWIYGNYSYLQGDSTEFDREYVEILKDYRGFFNRYGVEPDFSFNDEPGVDVDRRRKANHLNRLAKEAGVHTWVTYYDNCEMPLAGYELSFSDPFSGLTRTVPSWLTQDDDLEAYWDFEGDAGDRSTNSNDGTLHGGAEVVDGELKLHNESTDYVRVSHDPSLSMDDTLAIYLWFRPVAHTDGYARHPIEKWSGTSDANYVFYYFGNHHGNRPDNEGRVGFYANVEGEWERASGYHYLEELDGWYNLLWTYNSTAGGTLYLNGIAEEAPYWADRGRLTTNTADLTMGEFNGSMDEVILLDRDLEEDEIVDIFRSSSGAYDTSQTLTLSATVPASVRAPALMNITVVDGAKSMEGLETVKTLRVNGNEVWSLRGQARDFMAHTANLSSALQEGQADVVELEVRNNYSRREDLTIYFIDHFWRNLDWTVTNTSNWNWTHEPDPEGDLGPMDPFLDDRVYAMRYVSPEQQALAREQGDAFSYYTTYPANQPVIVNNRFLNGLYGSALDAETINVYAYGDWGSQPYDDLWHSHVERLSTTTGQRGQNTYELVVPSWDQEVLESVAWESLREGIEDSRIIATLERAVEENAVPEAVEAGAYLDDLFSRPSDDYSPRYMDYRSEEPIERYADRSADILADVAGDGDDYDFFDRMRRRMLDYLVRIVGNHPPEINTTDNVTCLEDRPYHVDYDATDIDPDGDVLNWSLNTTAPFLSMDRASGNLTGTPLNEHVGDHTVNVSVTDGRGGLDFHNFTLEVVNVNDRPVIVTRNVTVWPEDRPYRVDYNATDVDPTDDTLTWNLSTDASFLTMDRATGHLTGIPRNRDVGLHNVNISVEDGNGGSDHQNFSLEIVNVNDGPHVLAPVADVEMDEDSVDASINLSTVFADDEGDELMFTFGGNGNISVTLLDNGTVILEPPPDWSGNETLVFGANDSLAHAEEEVNVSVFPVNDPPTDATITLPLEAPYRENCSQPAVGDATDVDLPYGDSLTFSWYSNVTGEIATGREVNLSLPAGNHTVTLYVMDSGRASTHATVNLTVLSPDSDAPPPGPPPDPPDRPPDDRSDGWDTGLVAGLVTLMVVLVVASVLLFMYRDRILGGGGQDVAEDQKDIEVHEVPEGPEDQEVPEGPEEQEVPDVPEDQEVPEGPGPPLDKAGDGEVSP